MMQEDNDRRYFYGDVEGLPKAFCRLAETFEYQVFELCKGKMEKEYYVPYMMNDAVECYLILKNCRVVGEFLLEESLETSASLAVNDKGYVLSIRQGSENALTLYFDDMEESIHCYQYHQIGHFWVKGQEQWRQLVYMLGTVYDKYEYLGDAVLNQKEKELLGVIEFAPFREWSPIKESLEGRYPATYEGIDRMMALAREAGDISFVRLLRIYYKHPSMRVEYFLSRRLLSHKREKLYVLIWHKLKAASEAYDERDYGSSQNEDIKTKRRVIDSRLQSEGYSGKYPEYRKGDVQIIVTEEHPFTIMESEEFVFRTQFMVSKCIKSVKGGRNSGFFTGWGRQGKVEDTLEASLREADRMGQTRPQAHQEAVKGEDR